MKLIIKNKDLQMALRTCPHHMRMGQWLWNKFFSGTALEEGQDSARLFYSENGNWECYFYPHTIIDYGDLDAKLE